MCFLLPGMKLPIWMLIVAICLLTTSCDKPTKAEKDDPATNVAAAKKKIFDLQQAPIILPDQPQENDSGANIRSLDEIRVSGVLRVLVQCVPEPNRLHRVESVQDRELAMLMALADWLDVNIQLISTDKFSDLIPALQAGKGDIIADNLTITKERRRYVDFTIPYKEGTEKLITRAGRQLKSLSELNGKTIVVKNGTSYWEQAKKLCHQYPGIKLVSSDDDTEDLMTRIGKGKIEYTIADESDLAHYLHYANDVHAVYTFPQKRYMAMAVNKKSSKLLYVVNSFLRRELPIFLDWNGKSDLPMLQRRRILRVLTRDDPFNYFIHRGTEMGFEYELVKKFAAENNLKLVMVVPPKDDQLIPWLLEGRGDIIAATRTITPKRSANPHAVWCTPYMNVHEVVVTRSNDDRIKTPADLATRTFAVREGNSYVETLQKMQKKGIKINIKYLSDSIGPFEILQGISDGTYDISLMDDIMLKTKQKTDDKLKAAMTIGETKHYAWMVRKSNPLLQAAVNNFFNRINGGVFFKMLCHQYFEAERPSPKYQQDHDSITGGVISRFDPLLKEFSQKHNFDWRVIAALVCQESRFNPTIIAPDGGMGLMQLMPATVKRLDCRDPMNPTDNIKTGTEYMGILRNIFAEKNISYHDQLCFALACYNGGYGHLRDARILAAELDLNPNIWKDNVETAMMKLATQEYSTRARFGFCRADIITKYVNKIISRFFEYQKHTMTHPVENTDRKKSAVFSKSLKE